MKPASLAPPTPEQDPTAFTAFEALRQRAETEVASDSERLQRPSWAPPLVLEGELLETCRALDYLSADDKPIARLWATFATPKRSGRYLREHISALPLMGVSCRGFQLHAGATRGPTHAILFEAQLRKESGDWQFGPREYYHSYRSAYEHDWERLIREREHLRHELETHKVHYAEAQQQEQQTRLAALTEQINAIDTQDAEKADARRQRQVLRQRALELARARVLDFIGTPDAQRQMAGRLAGHCCICWKDLTDPISLEAGIGPECKKRKIAFIKTLAKGDHSPEQISVLAGMPVGFVIEVLNEVRHA